MTYYTIAFYGNGETVVKHFDYMNDAKEHRHYEIKRYKKALSEHTTDEQLIRIEIVQQIDKVYA